MSKERTILAKKEDRVDKMKQPVFNSFVYAIHNTSSI